MEKTHAVALFCDDGKLVFKFKHAESLTQDSHGNLLFIVFKDGAKREMIFSSKWKWIAEEEK